ncbi:MAG: reverse transcriptase domain-containing protein [bacterium]
MENVIRYKRRQHTLRYSPSKCWEFVQKFQKRQEQQIRKNPDYREKNVFAFITDGRTLYAAWERVKDNAGASGVDRESVRYIEELGPATRIKKLGRSLRDGTYKSLPLRPVKVPKPEGGKRELHIPNINDRIIMTAVVLALEVMVRLRFEDLPVHGFIPRRGPHAALEVLENPLALQAEFVIHLDVVKFFDRIDQGLFRERLHRYADDWRAEKLIWSWLRAGCLRGNLYVPAHEGIPQGSPLSPTLANIYLEGFDHWASGPEISEKFGSCYCRYADNLLWLCSRDPDGMVAAANERLAQDKLSAKGKIGGGKGWKKAVKPWGFLGFIIQRTDEGFVLRPNPERIRQRIERCEDIRRKAERRIRASIEGALRYYEPCGGIDGLSEEVRKSPDTVQGLKTWLDKEVRKR